jgi:hypothetical protein
MDWILSYLLDCLIFILKSIVRGLKAMGCGRWPAVSAAVTATPRISSTLSGGEVEIVYAYRITGELYTGIHEEPFLLPNSAQEYAARFPSGGSLVVRVDPRNPEKSVVRDADQRTSLSAVVSTGSSNLRV